MKSVQQILYAHETDMGGMPLRQPFPTQQIDQIDPFLLLHHHSVEIPPHSRPMGVWVDPHPHRGFSPVTFIYRGNVHHRDSRGNHSVVFEGGVQWMNAGRGIIHSERPSIELAEKGGHQEIIQLWINMPASKKMDAPSYIALQPESIPTLNPDFGEGKFKIVSGAMNGFKGAISAPWEVLSLMGEMKENSEHIFTVKEGESTFLYLLEGRISIEGFGLVDGHNLVNFQKEKTAIHVKVKADTRFLLVSAPPINEPVVKSGPFVMNTQTQILEAMRDYRMGKMGILIEE